MVGPLLEAAEEEVFERGAALGPDAPDRRRLLSDVRLDQPCLPGFGGEGAAARQELVRGDR